MKKGLFGFAFFAICAITLLCIKANLAKADGGIFYPHDYYSAETTQKAFISFANSTENLVVLASFRGNAKDFAWVIPTPSKPEINKGSVDLFNDLAEITKTTDSGPDIIYDQPTFGLSGGSKSQPVEVISEKTVDVYNTAVLKATDENALAEWLFNNGYSFPTDKSSELKNYVESGWYFAIAKIKPDLISGGGIASQLDEGTLTPLRLTFQTDKIIYPMKLTGLALTQSVPPTATQSLNDNSVEQQPVITSNIPITLYVLSNHKTEQSLLTTSWANWINQADIKKLNDNLGANIITGDKSFLTKMSNTIDAKDITDDFIITTASSDQIYPTPAYKTAGFWFENLMFLILVPLIFIFFPIPLGLIFLVFILLQYFVKKKWLYVVGNVYQLLTCLILLLIGLAVLLINNFNLSDLWKQNGFIGGSISLIVLEVIVIYLTVKMLRRYKQTFPPKI